MKRTAPLFLSCALALLFTACAWNNDEQLLEQARVKQSMERILKTTLQEGMTVDEVAAQMKAQGIGFDYGIHTRTYMGGISLKAIAHDTPILVSMTFHFSEKGTYQRADVRLMHSFL